MVVDYHCIVCITIVVILKMILNSLGKHSPTTEMATVNNNSSTDNIVQEFLRNDDENDGKF